MLQVHDVSELVHLCISDFLQEVGLTTLVRDGRQKDGAAFPGSRDPRIRRAGDERLVEHESEEIWSGRVSTRKKYSNAGDFRLIALPSRNFFQGDMQVVALHGLGQ